MATPLGITEFSTVENQVSQYDEQTFGSTSEFKEAGVARAPLAKSSSKSLWRQMRLSASLSQSSECRICSPVASSSSPTATRKEQNFLRQRCFPLILQRGKLKKRVRGAKLQVTQKITSRSPLRFWRSVSIGVWSARDHFVPLTMRAMRFPSRLVRGIGEQKVGRTLLLLLKLPSLGNSFSPGSGDSLRRRYQGISTLIREVIL